MSFIRSVIENAARAGKVVLDHFSYEATWAPLGIGATVQVTVPISADSDFVWMETALVVMTAANVLDPAPDLLISFTDQGSGRNLQDNPVHVMNVTGNGQWPYVLPEPKLLIGSGGLQITLTDLSGVAKARVDLTLIGTKVFYPNANYTRSSLLSGF